MTRSRMITRLCVMGWLLSHASLFLFAQSQPPLPPVNPEDITFVGPDGRILSVQAVQERMQAFNTASGQLLENLGQTPPDAQHLKVITFNAGMLNLLPNVVDVPKYAERSKLLIPALERVNFDILCLQEVFYGPDIWRLKRFARQHGYHLYRGHLGLVRNVHGMVVLIKKGLSDEAPTFNEHRFHVMAWHERLFGFRKGVLSAKIKLKNGRTLGLTTTHLTAYLRQENIRIPQVKAMMEVIDALGADYTLVAGDLNSTMEPYPTGHGTSPTRLTIAQRLISRFNLVDAYTVTNPGKNEPTVTLVENPTAEFGISTNLGHTAEERIDFIFARAKKDIHTAIHQGGRLFMEDIPVKSRPPWWAFWHWGRGKNRQWKSCKLSDHFGLFADLTLF